MASADVHEDLTCSICLNIYTDPVTLNCGHNFCRECIKQTLDTKEKNHEDFSCPQCRKRFRGRPSLQKNTDLSNIAEKMKSSADQNRKCSDHNKILEYYCTWDSTCICVVCKFDDKHRGHEEETLEEATERKKKKLRNDLQKLTNKREKIDRRVRELNQHEAKVTKHISEITEKVSELFIEIRNHLDDLEKRVRSEISRQAEQKVLISDLIHKLEVQKEELSRKIGHLEEMSTADTITLLQDQESDGDNKYKVDLYPYKEREPDEFIISMMLQKGLSDMERLKNVCFPVLSEGTNITLYINTADENVEISEDRKTAKSTDVKQKRPNSAIPFKNGWVLSTQEFSSGRHYWVVEGSTSGEWGVGMCYSSMSKDWGWLGQVNCWEIRWSGGSYSVPYRDNHKPLNDTNSSNKVLVYLDYEAGRLSFYELYDPPCLIHTFTYKFTEPLRVVLQATKNYNNKHGQITMLQKDAWCNPMLGPITSV